MIHLEGAQFHVTARHGGTDRVALVGGFGLPSKSDCL